MFYDCEAQNCDALRWNDIPQKGCFSCNQVRESGKIYERKASEFEAKAADLSRKRKHSEI